MTTEDRALRYISTIEAVSGEGGHTATFKAAAALRNGFVLSVEEALPIMLRWNEHHALPPWSEHQIEQKLKSIDGVPPIKPEGYLLNDVELDERNIPRISVEHLPRYQRPRWPNCQTDQVIALLQESLITLPEFQESSPIAPAEVGPSNEIIDYLFCRGDENPDPFLCLGKSMYHATASTREAFRNRLATETWELIVPNPLIGSGKLTTLGNLSPRAKSNIKERRFIVIECDFEPKNHPQLFHYLQEAGLSVQDLCATILAKLSETAPLAMAVNSGNKSIHGWFPVQGATSRVQYEFFREACNLGADSHMGSPNQWTRFPNGYRSGTKAKQAVEFLSDDPFIVNY